MFSAVWTGRPGNRVAWQNFHAVIAGDPPKRWILPFPRTHNATPYLSHEWYECDHRVADESDFRAKLGGACWTLSSSPPISQPSTLTHQRAAAARRCHSRVPLIVSGFVESADECAKPFGIEAAQKLTVLPQAGSDDKAVCPRHISRDVLRGHSRAYEDGNVCRFLDTPQLLELGHSPVLGPVTITPSTRKNSACLTTSVMSRSPVKA